MRPSAWLLLIVGAFIVAEIWLLNVVGSAIGVWWTLAILVGEAVLGGWLLRREWPRAMRAIAESRDEPDQIKARLTDAVLVFVGAVLVVWPGFISDVFGLVFLLPPTRGLGRRLALAVGRRLTRRVRDQVVIMDARVNPETVVPGDVVGDQAPRRRPGDDGEVISGEILP